MCGIAGFAHVKPSRIKNRMTRILKDLGHRGPDQSGYFESSYATLGAVRLAIVDLDRGAQPVVMENPKIVIIFNGEIYNHSTLRAQLEQRGHRFRSHCDTETVLRAFLEWDTGAFARLHGMFALAIWNEDERRLVLVRDRMGIKPLYFAQQGASIYFGSELKAIFAHDEVDRRLNVSALQHFLSLNYVPGPQTLVEGIEKLPPGSYMEWHAGRSRIERFWELTSPPPLKATFAEATDQLDKLLRQSVREHLSADVPVGLWVSGGLDSSTILHYASQLSSNRLQTYSVTFAGRSFDESRESRLLAQHYGTDHHEIDVSPSLDLADAVERMAFYSDEPNADAGAVPLWFLSQKTRENVKVALTGDGADELFAGYQTYAADALKRKLSNLPSPLLRLGSSLARLLPASNQKIGFDYKATRFLSGLSLSDVSAHLFWNGTFSEREKQALLLSYQPSLARSFFSSVNWRRENWLQEALLLDQRFYLCDNILAKCDRMSMAHAIEVRPPFLDHRIVDFANSLAPHVKRHKGTSKRVLRHLLRDKLPVRLLRKKKEGLDIPIHHWLRTAFRPLLLDTLSSPNVKSSGLFDDSVLQGLIADHLQRRKNVGYHLWGVLVLFLWMNRWGISSGSETRRSRFKEEELRSVATL